MTKWVRLMRCLRIGTGFGQLLGLHLWAIGLLGAGVPLWSPLIGTNGPRRGVIMGDTSSCAPVLRRAKASL